MPRAEENFFEQKKREIQEHWRAEFPEGFDAMEQTGWEEGFLDGMVLQATQHALLATKYPVVAASVLKLNLLNRRKDMGEAKFERAFLDDMLAACESFLPQEFPIDFTGIEIAEEDPKKSTKKAKA